MYLLYSPDDAPGTGGNGPSTDNVEETIKFLSDEVPEDEPIDLTPPPAKKKDGDEEDEEEDDEKPAKAKDEDEGEGDDEVEDLVDELEEPTEEQLELASPVRRKEILKKYPNLFKDFPYLEKAYYREQQFTELLPTIDDARQAVQSAQVLNKFENDLVGGSAESVFKAVKEDNPQAFNKIVDDLLPSLARVDEAAYHHVLSNTIKHTIIAMVTEGKRSNNDVLQSAAQILNQFVFGSSDFQNPTKLSKDEPKVDPREAQIQQREYQLTRRQFDGARSDLNSRINNSVTATIEANIDPRGTMSDYVRKNAVREVGESIAKLLATDSRFTTIADKLWEHAFKNNFSKDSTDRIRSAYLSKAKIVLPSLIKKARNEALRGMGKRVREESEDSPRETKERDKPQSKDSGPREKKGDIPRGMKTIDYLMQD